jgi:hypothetical protein
MVLLIGIKGEKMNKKVLWSLLPMAIAITIIYFTMYVIVQQNYRMNANDPQIQMAQDQAVNLNSTEGTGLSYGQKIDISTTLTTFNVVFDKNQKLLTPITVKNETPSVPSGVFSYTAKHGEDRFTWSPGKGVRVAAVMEKFDHGYILVGRSLKEVEKRISNMGDMVFIAWLFTLIFLYFSTVYLKRKSA